MTGAVGWLVSTTEKVAVVPSSPVSPLMAETVTPALSLSVRVPVAVSVAVTGVRGAQGDGEGLRAFQAGIGGGGDGELLRLAGGAGEIEGHGIIVIIFRRRGAIGVAGEADGEWNGPATALSRLTVKSRPCLRSRSHPRW